ncbi:MAG: tetratricopeptide repeat protein [Elusimicrobiales bacterium]|nr:tetratricopeptide repeat protein [Elusimicrobiales bacterium]
MPVSGDKRGRLRHALKKILHSYGAPLGMFLFFVLAALYIFMGRARGPAPEFPRAPSEFMQAARAERRLAELGKVLEADPEDIKALAESGRLKYQLGQQRYIEAIADLERARKLGLADARSFYYLGSMYQAVGLYDFSAQEYRKFLNNFPDDSEARMLLAKLCYAAGDYPGAVREFEKLLSDGSRDPVMLENLALSRWKNGQDYSSTLSDLRARGAAGAFLADYAEGRIKYELKEYPAAQALLKKAAEAVPAAGTFADQSALLWMAGDSANRSGDAQAALYYLRELMRASPGHEEGRILLAKLEKAAAAAEKARAAAAEKARVAAEKAAKAQSARKKQ